MIGMQATPFSEVVDAIGAQQRLFVTGCGGCAEVCHTGGEPEVEGMVRQLLQAKG
jgi:ferredoxin